MIESKISAQQLDGKILTLLATCELDAIKATLEFCNFSIVAHTSLKQEAEGQEVEGRGEEVIKEVEGRGVGGASLSVLIAT